MKIGILTFHCAHNYGAVLQAYALQNFLEEQGYDVEIIDYRPMYLICPYDLFSIRKNESVYGTIKTLINQVINIRKRYMRRKSFEKFITNNLRLSDKQYKNGKFDKIYDIYILGSDQIWNNGITENDPIFWGEFEKKKNSILITYAASTEGKNIKGELNFSSHKKDLNNFHNISVREKVLADILQPLTTKIIKSVLDPTLLVSSEIFSSMMSLPKRQEKYILIYQAIRDRNTWEIAKCMIKNTNLLIREIIADNIVMEDYFNKFSALSPESVLGLIKSAEYVVTTSFHGVALSIVFKKQFICIMNENRGNCRISSLLNRFGLEDRMVYDENSIPKDTIDYDKIYKQLEGERKESVDFLLNALQ
ncbi:MAG: polysaccharide pyruvyl transferase family protein [Prevotellaceae bacterium]|jgi:hypothetical protein|nr:polysaccharide pyruvyl transferase family protein [Prevotellaceae bacterium]